MLKFPPGPAVASRSLGDGFEKRWRIELPATANVHKVQRPHKGVSAYTVFSKKMRQFVFVGADYFGRKESTRSPLDLGRGGAILVVNLPCH